MLRLCNISKSYKIKDAASTQALQDVSLDIGDGESVAIMGGSFIYNNMPRLARNQDRFYGKAPRNHPACRFRSSGNTARKAF